MRVGVTGWYSPPDAEARSTCADAIGVSTRWHRPRPARVAHSSGERGKSTERSARGHRTDRNPTVMNSGTVTIDVRVERRRDRIALDDGHQTIVFAVVDGRRLVDQHHRDVVADLVAAMQTRVVQDRLGLEVVQRTLVVGAGEDLEQFGRRAPCGVHSASVGLRRWVESGQSVMADSSAATRSSQASRSDASRFRRSSGSVFDGRRLNHQSRSRPSDRRGDPACASAILRADPLDHGRRRRRPGC